MTEIIPRTLGNLVKPKAGAKHELFSTNRHLGSCEAEIFEACLTLVVSQKWDTTKLRQVSHRKKMIWLKKNEISQMGGAYLMSQKLKICKCISYACLTLIWLANSGSIELCEIIYQLNLIYLCISYFCQQMFNHTKRIFVRYNKLCDMWHVSHLILRQISYRISTWDKTSMRQASKISIKLGRVGWPM